MKIEKHCVLVLLGLFSIHVCNSERLKFSSESSNPDFESQRKTPSQSSAIDRREEVRLTNKHPSRLQPQLSRRFPDGVGQSSTASSMLRDRRKPFGRQKFMKRISDPVDIDKDVDNVPTTEKVLLTTTKKDTSIQNTTGSSVEVPSTITYDSVRISEKSSNNTVYKFKKKLKKRPRFNLEKKSEEKPVIYMNNPVSSLRNEKTFKITPVPKKKLVQEYRENSYPHEESDEKVKESQNKSIWGAIKINSSQGSSKIAEDSQLEDGLPNKELSKSIGTENSSRNEKDLKSNLSPIEKNKKRQKKVKRLRKRPLNKNSPATDGSTTTSAPITDTTSIFQEIEKTSFSNLNVNEDGTENLPSEKGTEDKNTASEKFENIGEYSYGNHPDYYSTTEDHHESSFPTDHRSQFEVKTKPLVPKNRTEDSDTYDGYYLTSFNYKGNDEDKPKDVIKLPISSTKKPPAKKASFVEKKASLGKNNKQQSEYKERNRKEKHPHLEKFDFSKRHKIHPEEEEDDWITFTTPEPEIYINYEGIKKVNQPVVNYKRKAVKKVQELTWKPSKSEPRPPQTKPQELRKPKDDDGRVHFLIKSNIRNPYPSKTDFVNQKSSKEISSGRSRDTSPRPRKAPENYPKKKPVDDSGKYYIHMFKKVGDFSFENHDPNSDPSSKNDGYMSSIKLRWDDDDRRAKIETSVDSRVQPFQLFMRHNHPFEKSYLHAPEEPSLDEYENFRTEDEKDKRQFVRKNGETSRNKRSNDHPLVFVSHFPRPTFQNVTFENNFPYRVLMGSAEKMIPSETSFHPQTYQGSPEKVARTKHPEIRSYYLKPPNAEEARKFASEFRDKQFTFPFTSYQKPARQRETKKVEVFRAYHLPDRPPQLPNKPMEQKSVPAQFFTNAKQVKNAALAARNTKAGGLVYPRKNLTKNFNSKFYGAPSEPKLSKITKPLFKNEYVVSKQKGPVMSKIGSYPHEIKNGTDDSETVEQIPQRREFRHTFKHITNPSFGDENGSSSFEVSADGEGFKRSFDSRLNAHEHKSAKTDHLIYPPSYQLHQLPSTTFGNYVRSKSGKKAAHEQSLKRSNYLEDENYNLQDSDDDSPRYTTIPKTRFSCHEHRAGYYADTETGCQVFHLCVGPGEKHSFLCPDKTLFNQHILVCDWANKVNCETSEEFYSVNERVFQTTPAPQEYKNDNYLHEEIEDPYYNSYSEGRSSRYKPKKHGIEKLTSYTTHHDHHDSSENLETAVSPLEESEKEIYTYSEKDDNEVNLSHNNTNESYRKAEPEIGNRDAPPKDTSPRRPKGYHYFKEDEYVIMHDVAHPQRSWDSRSKQLKGVSRKKWNPVKIPKQTPNHNEKDTFFHEAHHKIQDFDVKKESPKYQKPEISYKAKKVKENVRYGYTPKKQKEYKPTFKSAYTLADKKKISIDENADVKESASTDSIKTLTTKLPILHKRKRLFPDRALKPKNVHEYPKVRNASSVRTKNSSPDLSHRTKHSPEYVLSEEKIEAPRLELSRQKPTNKSPYILHNTSKTEERDTVSADTGYQYPLAVAVKNASDPNFVQRMGDSELDSQIPQPENPSTPEEPKKHHVERKNVDLHLDINARIADIFSGIKSIGTDVSKILDNKENLYKNIQISKSLPISDPLNKGSNITLPEPFTFEKLLPKTVKETKRDTEEASRKQSSVIPKVDSITGGNAEITLNGEPIKKYSDLSANTTDVNNEAYGEIHADEKDSHNVSEGDKYESSIPHRHPDARNSNAYELQGSKDDLLSVDTLNKPIEKDAETQRNETSQTPSNHTGQTVSESKIQYTPSESVEDFREIHYSPISKQQPPNNQHESIVSVQDSIKEIDQILTRINPDTEALSEDQLNHKNFFRHTFDFKSPNFETTLSNHFKLGTTDSNKFKDSEFLSGARGRHSFEGSLPQRHIPPIMTPESRLPVQEEETPALIAPARHIQKTPESKIQIVDPETGYSPQDLHQPIIPPTHTRSKQILESQIMKPLPKLPSRNTLPATLFPPKKVRLSPTSESQIVEPQPRKYSTKDTLPAFLFPVKPPTKLKLLDQNLKHHEKHSPYKHPVLNRPITQKLSSKPSDLSPIPPAIAKDDGGSSPECDSESSEENVKLPTNFPLGKHGPYNSGPKSFHRLAPGAKSEKTPPHQKTRNKCNPQKMTQDRTPSERSATPIHSVHKISLKERDIHTPRRPELRFPKKIHAVHEQTKPIRRHPSLLIRPRRPSPTHLKSMPASSSVLKEPKFPLDFHDHPPKYERVPVTEKAYPEVEYRHGAHRHPHDRSEEHSEENTGRSAGPVHKSKYASLERAAELAAVRLIQSKSKSSR